MINEKHLRWFKYADDTASVGLLQKTDPSHEAVHTEALQTCCCISQLEINVAGTKELIMLNKKHPNTETVSLDGQHVETVLVATKGNAM